MNTKRDYKSFDFFLAILVISLAVLGIVLIGSAADIDTAEKLPKEFTGQIIWVVTGVIIMIVMSFIDFQYICKFYIPIYIFNIILLVAVIVLGPLQHVEQTAYRSIYFGSFGSIQPSEFNKLFMIIFLARYIDINREKINNILILGSVLLLTLIPVVLIQRQPSLSASLVTVVVMTIMLFVTKLNYRYFVIAFFLVVPLTVIIAYDVSSANIEVVDIKEDEDAKSRYKVTYDGNSMSPILIDKILSPYQISRLKIFAEPSEKDEGYYQTGQAIKAIGSGQLSGKGLFNAEVYVPEAMNDFIFAVLAEEFGFIGCVATLALVFLIVFRCLVIAGRSEIFYGKLIAAAVAGMIAFQVFGNVGVNTGILPNTGMIFPFISSGGSAMWMFMALIGMVINIGMTKTKSMFQD